MILKICNCCVFASLLVYSNFPVYYLWRFFANLPICCTFLVYYLARICQPPPLFRPRLLFETQEYMDTDSFVIHIKTLLMTLKWFDTSNYSKDDNRPLPIGWKIMKEFVGLRAKTWAYLLDDDSEHKEKRKEQKYA